VEDLGAEERQLGGLGERHRAHLLRAGHDPRIGGHDAVDVGPDLDLLRAERGAEDRGGESRCRRGRAW
jgi:hypothetical protein